MKEKELHLTTIEQAKRLKALGFDWETRSYYSTLHNEGSVLKEFSCACQWNSGTGSGKTTAAPTVALALRWIRDKKKLKNAVCLCKWSNTTDGSVREVYQPSIRCKLGFEYSAYEEAESAMLDDLLTILEK
jgi:hypothetical protein